jgi:hypothetical protein
MSAQLSPEPYAARAQQCFRLAADAAEPWKREALQLLADQLNEVAEQLFRLEIGSTPSLVKRDAIAAVVAVHAAIATGAAALEVAGR